MLLSEIFVSDDPMSADQIEIANLEPDAMLLDDWWLCSFPNYFALPTGTTIPPGGILVVTLGSGTDTASEIFAPTLGTLATNDGEVVLYAAANDFDDPDTIGDYVQWGEAGNDRELVASEAGVWAAATFVSTATLADGSESVTRLVSDGSVTGADAWGVAAVSIGAAN